MSDQKNQNWKLGFGLLAGALAGFWLNSDRGRRVRHDFQQSAVEYSNQAGTYIKDQANTLGNATNEYIAQGKQALNSAATTVKNKFTTTVDEVADDAEDAIDGTEAKLKRGIANARRNVKNSAETIV